MKKIIVCLALLLCVGCATMPTTDKLMLVEPGMTEQELIAILEYDPEGVGYKNNQKILYYRIHLPPAITHDYSFYFQSGSLYAWEKREDQKIPQKNVHAVVPLSLGK